MRISDIHSSANYPRDPSLRWCWGDLTETEENVTELTWGSLQWDMMAALAGEPVDIAGVVDQLTEVQKVLEGLPPLYDENPVADFNKLYTTITRRILQRHEADDFADPAFLNRLDVEFARRYIQALRWWSVGSSLTPRAWRVLFERAADTELRSLPCAVAGVNAHINFDLPFALVATWEHVGHTDSGSRQHRDYLLVNEAFETEIPGLRRAFLAGWQRHIDRLNLGFDDWYQNLLVELSRGLAWERAQKLWSRRRNRSAVEVMKRTFDGQTARVGRALLSPFCAYLQ
jgi:hypothetical protein